MMYCPKCGSETVHEMRERRDFCGFCGHKNADERVSCPKRRHLLDGHWDSGWFSLRHFGCQPTARLK
jgi:hypothetical protein